MAQRAFIAEHPNAAFVTSDWSYTYAPTNAAVQKRAAMTRELGKPCYPIVYPLTGYWDQQQRAIYPDSWRVSDLPWRRAECKDELILWYPGNTQAPARAYEMLAAKLEADLAAERAAAEDRLRAALEALTP